MDSTGGFGGSRSEFLPGEIFEESDIKYQRNGGCFVSHKKGSFVFLTTLALIALSCASMYFYGPRWRDKKINLDAEGAEEALIGLLECQEPQKKDLEMASNQRKLKPTEYEIYIKPFLDNETFLKFEGNVTIKLEIEKPTKSLTLHSKDLIIKQVLVTYQSTNIVRPLVFASLVAEDTDETNSTLPIEENVEDNNNSTEITENTDGMTTILPEIEEVNNTGTNKTEESAEETTQQPKEEMTVIPIIKNSSVVSSTTEATKVVEESKVDDTQTNVIDDNEIKKNEEKIEQPSNKTETSSSPEKSSIDTSSAEPTMNDVNDNIVVMKSRMWKGSNKIRIDFDEERLLSGIKYTVKIIFNGVLSDRYGAVKSEYLNEDTKNKSWNVVTNFHPNFTQNMFPCINEPWYKAKYQINVARRSNKKTLSTMPLKSSQQDESDNGWIWDKFETTPPMSIDSIGFVIHDLSSKLIPTETGEIMNIWGRQKLLEKADYLIKVAPKLLNFYNTFFGYHYPLSKIDLVALPNLNIDVNDNFGLITFSENIAAVNDQSSKLEKETLIKAIAQGITRQWFGGIVNVRTRDEYWILDGLSTYMTYLGVNDIEPTWEKLNDFSDVILNVLRSENDINLRNNFIDVNDKASLKAMENKASSLIRMLNNSLTDVVFIKGLRKYIDSAKNESAAEDSLWNVLTQAGQLDLILPKDITIKSIIDKWFELKGNLLLDITRDYEKGTAKIHLITQPEGQILIVPLNYITAETKNWNAATKIWINEHIQTVKNVTSKNWVLFNIHRSTPCRINYDLTNWNFLIRQLYDDPNVIPPINRAQLIDDGFHLARHGYLDYNVVLNLTNYLKEKEKHSLPWETFFNNLDEIYLTMYRTGEFGYLQDYILNLIKPSFDELGISPKDTDNYHQKKLRQLITKWLCNLNQKVCIDETTKQYELWEKDPEGKITIDYELRGTMFCSAVRELGKSTWDFLWNRYKNPITEYNDKKSKLVGLGCARETWLLIRYFRKALNTSEISINDAALLWENLPLDASIHEGFEFIRENWKEIFQVYGHDENLIKTIINSFITKLSSRNEINELTRFFFIHEELKPYTKQLAEAAKTIKTRLEWKDKYLLKFTSSLKSFT